MKGVLLKISARRYAAPLIVVYAMFALLVIGVLLLTTPNRLIAAFSARYLGLILEAVPYLIVGAGLHALLELYRPAMTASFPRATTILVVLAPVFHPVALVASLHAFPGRPEIVLGRVVAGLFGVSVLLLCFRGATTDPRSESNVLDTVVRVLYDDLRFFLLGAFVFSVLHFVMQTPRPGVPPIQLGIAVPFALVLGAVSGIPNAVLPLAALFVSDRFPAAATVVLLASGAVIPMRGMLAGGSPRMRRVVAGVAAAVVIVTVAIVWTGVVGSGGGA